MTWNIDESPYPGPRYDIVPYKPAVYFQPLPPSKYKAGDIWIDTRTNEHYVPQIGGGWRRIKPIINITRNPT